MLVAGELVVGSLSGGVTLKHVKRHRVGIRTDWAEGCVILATIARGCTLWTLSEHRTKRIFILSPT